MQDTQQQQQHILFSKAFQVIVSCIDSRDSVSNTCLSVTFSELQLVFWGYGLNHRRPIFLTISNAHHSRVPWNFLECHYTLLRFITYSTGFTRTFVCHIWLKAFLLVGNQSNKNTIYHKKWDLEVCLPLVTHSCWSLCVPPIMLFQENQFFFPEFSQKWQQQKKKKKNLFEIRLSQKGWQAHSKCS